MRIVKSITFRLLCRPKQQTKKYKKLINKKLIIGKSVESHSPNRYAKKDKHEKRMDYGSLRTAAGWKRIR